MIGERGDWDEFIKQHRWAVLTTLGSSGDPSSSVVAYARDGDELLISTPGGTFKRRAIEQDPRVSLCILSNSEPFNFVTVKARAEVTKDNLLARTKKVFANIQYPEPEDFTAWLTDQDRVILRLIPTRVYGVIR